MPYYGQIKQKCPILDKYNIKEKKSHSELYVFN